MNPFDRLERIIYHYTDLNALISILGFEHTTLWASNASFLNDSSELMQGIALINKLHPSNLKLEDFKDYYLTSFSNTEDSLVMWNHYGAHGGGCCIGFDYDAIQKVYGSVCNCCYGEKEAQDLLKNTLNLIDNGVTTAFGMPQPTPEEQLRNREISRKLFLQATCLMAKNEAYRHEDETRGYICVPPNQYKYVKFREVNNYIVPYIQMPLPKDAVKKIVIGPTLNADVTRESIKRMLEIRGYNLNENEIIRSKVPYRG